LARILDTLPSELRVLLVTRDRDLGAREPYPGLSGAWVPRGAGATVHYLDTGSPRGWWRLLRVLRAEPIDLLYLNSLFSLAALLPTLAVALRLVPVRQVLLAPRGELSPGALALKGRKKRIFLRLWLPLLRRLGVRWQACSEPEAEHIRAAAGWAQILVNANEPPPPAAPVPAPWAGPVPPPRTEPGSGSSLPAGSGAGVVGPGGPGEFGSGPQPPARTGSGAAGPGGPALGGPLRLVFVSRISPKKNLALALAALRRVTHPVELDVYGPLEDPGYWRRCRDLIAELPGHVRVRYRGELTPEQVGPTFGRYDGFLFPTLGENFGHVIVESLAASCPVLCSAETPFGDLIEAAAGAVVDPLTEAALAAAVDRFAATDGYQRQAAKRTAGHAYRRWYAETRVENILSRALTPQPAPTTPTPSGAGPASPSEPAPVSRR
jgi:glycosyltransferase involved in cell wall biosynthesis